MPTSLHPDGTAILCRCCSQPGRRQKLAEVHPGEGMSFQDRRHGAKHTASLTMHDVLVRLTGTTDGSAILRYVQMEVRGS